MEFLDSLVLPQSKEHIQLLHYMSMIVMFLFIPFLGLLIGGTTLSVFFRKKGTKTKEQIYFRFAREIIELIAVNKKAGLFLGIVPIITLLLIYSQLLHTLKMASTAYLLFALFFIVPGVILVYTYRYSFQFSSLFSKLTLKNSEDEIKEEFESVSENSEAVSKKSGLWSLILLITGSYFFTGAITLAAFPNEWVVSNNILHIFISSSIFIKWLYFIGSSFALTGGYILFAYFYWEGGKENLGENYAALVKETALKVTIWGSLSIPVFVMLHVIALPVSSLTTTGFIFTFIGLLFVFAVYHFVYDMIKRVHLKFAGWTFMTLLFAVVVLIISDQMAINSGTKEHSLLLATNYDALIQAETTAEGAEVLSGADIFNLRCAACHKFDQKMVGPPYNETLPKYEGDIKGLIKYINNPVKVNPEYPSMPAQGLKPKEARAVSEYILEEYKKY